MFCQKCRQPLKLDSSLESLNPAAYDLLISATTPQSSSNRPSEPKSPASRSEEQPRKSLYDKISQKSTQPTFKRHHGSHPRDSTMSFIYLTESQVGGHALQPAGHNSPTQSPQPRPAHNSLERGTKAQLPSKGDEMDRINRLFEILSARSDIDHPVCVDCTELLVEGLERKLEASSRERDTYVRHLKRVQAENPTPEQIKSRQEGLQIAEQAKSEAMAELRKLEQEKDTLDDEILTLEEESRQLDKEEDFFWRERNAFASRMADFQSERDSINAKYNHDSQLLDKLERSNVHNDTFCISHDGSFATINGLRLGRLSNKPVDWPEINAAWGHALLLVVTVADKLDFKFQGFEPQPMGSTSKIIRYETSSPASSRLGSRPMQAPPKKHILELYSSGDMPLGLTFMHRKFDNAMVAFLELVRQLGIQIRKETPPDEPPLKLPYKIEGDKIGDVSIKLGIAQDDGWTKACKLTLTCCKFLLAHASNVASTSMDAA